MSAVTWHFYDALGRETSVQDPLGFSVTLSGEVRRLTEEINTLEKQIVEHRRPAEELNAELQGYLGQKELNFEIKETGYAKILGLDLDRSQKKEFLGIGNKHSTFFDTSCVVGCASSGLYEPP